MLKMTGVLWSAIVLGAILMGFGATPLRGVKANYSDGYINIDAALGDTLELEITGWPHSSIDGLWSGGPEGVMIDLDDANGTFHTTINVPLTKGPGTFGDKITSSRPANNVTEPVVFSERFVIPDIPTEAVDGVIRGNIFYPVPAGNGFFRVEQSPFKVPMHLNLASDPYRSLKSSLFTPGLLLLFGGFATWIVMLFRHSARHA